MSHREMLTKQLQDGIDEASAVGLCNLFRIYNVREPLIDAIKRGEAYLWESDEVRSLIADVMAGAKQGKGRPKKLEIEQRNFRLLCELHYLSGAGVTMYATTVTNKQTACEIIAERYHLEESTIRDLWKARKSESHPLFSVANKAGKASREV